MEGSSGNSFQSREMRVKQTIFIDVLPFHTYFIHTFFFFPPKNTIFNMFDHVYQCFSSCFIVHHL